MATDVEVPAMGESISEATVLQWLKQDGDSVAVDEPICELETDKATFDLPAPGEGILHPVKKVGETVHVGEVIAKIESTPGGASKKEPKTRSQPASASQKSSAESPPTNSPQAPDKKPAAKELPARSSSKPPLHEQHQPPAKDEREPAPPKTEGLATGKTKMPATRQPAKPAGSPQTGDGQRRVPMSKIRRKIAERLVHAQQTAAMLTTFNEIDMTTVLELRARHREAFQKKHGVPLGLMSFFARACVLALKQFPELNAEIDGGDIIYHEAVHLGIAVSTERGLVVPILRDAERMSFARFESEIQRVASAARDGKLALEELSGGTFTITNGGVFGSLLSTPILNPPQTGILGMHTIQKRAMVIEDRIEPRSMMYVALTYDHRLVDGQQAVQFLVKVKNLLEDPLGMLVEI